MSNKRRGRKNKYKMGIVKMREIKVYYSNGTLDSMSSFFANNNYNSVVVKKPEEADLIILEGGADIDPVLYKQKQNTNTSISHYSKERDKKELELIDTATICDIPILGICRGFQLLSIYSGGALVQDVSHQGNHFIEALIGNRQWVNSAHHQMVHLDNLEEPSDYIALAWTNNISPYHMDGDGKEISFKNPERKEIEAAFFPKINALGVQWHPEWLSKSAEANTWLFNILRLYEIVD